MSTPLAQIAYGRVRIPLVLDPELASWHVVAPKAEAPLADPKAAFGTACREPIGSAPLRERVRPDDRVVIVTSDGTRPVPNRLLIPWLLEQLPVPAEQVCVLVGTGTHRASTDEELAALFGEDLLRRVRVVNHNAYAPEEHVRVGTTAAGTPVLLNRAYVEADRRIAVGFIEPHFFAGFSGGPKAVAPGIAHIDTILGLHSYELIAHPNSTWGVLEGNPLHEAIAAATALCPPDFLANVTLNADKSITGLFLGDSGAAHAAGCAHVRQHAMASVPHAFPIVVTSNNGYPLDQNVYQSVKGMSAAARIVEPGGSILVASECSDGVPDHGNFGAMLREHATAADLDAHLRQLPSPVLDQWEAQILVQVLERCRVGLYSSLDDETVRQCKLAPVADLAHAVAQEVEAVGRGAPVAVLPEGPVTIPYVA